MTDNVQPLHGTSTPSLPEVEPSPVAAGSTTSATHSAGVSADLPDASTKNPMPVWFIGLVIAIVLIMSGGAYVGYLVLIDQLSLPGAQSASLATPAAPPIPPVQTSNSKTQDVPPSKGTPEPQYQINITPPVAETSVSAIPKAPSFERAVVAPTPINVEATPTFGKKEQHKRVSLPAMLEANTQEVLSEHSERLLALEGMAAEHAEVIALMKEELRSTKRQVIATDQSIEKVIRRIDGLTGKAENATASNRSAIAKRASALPFKPLSYRTFGEQISVRVRSPLQKARSLRIGQALSGWRLLLSLIPISEPTRPY